MVSRKLGGKRTVEEGEGNEGNAFMLACLRGCWG